MSFRHKCSRHLFILNANLVHVLCAIKRVHTSPVTAYDDLNMVAMSYDRCVT